MSLPADTETLAFDTSPLSCFARAERLEQLDALTSGHRRVVTLAVLDELREGAADHPSLGQVEQLGWLEHVRVDRLIQTGGARFPCDGATFLPWATAHGLLDDTD